MDLYNSLSCLTCVSDIDTIIYNISTCIIEYDYKSLDTHRERIISAYIEENNNKNYNKNKDNGSIIKNVLSESLRCDPVTEETSSTLVNEDISKETVKIVRKRIMFV